MELLKGVVADQGLRVVPRREAVGAVGELELLGQDGMESQMGGETGLNSGQLDEGSDDFGRLIPLKTPDRLKGLLGPKAEKELAE